MKKKVLKSKMESPCKCGHRSSGYTNKDFDMKMIREGMLVEYEHTCDSNLAAQIAQDHISEMGYGYYPGLAKLEKKLLKQNKGKEFMKDNRKCRCKKEKCK